MLSTCTVGYRVLQEDDISINESVSEIGSCKIQVDIKLKIFHYFALY